MNLFLRVMIVLLLIQSNIRANNDKRCALIIENADYTTGKLKTPLNDAMEMPSIPSF